MYNYICDVCKAHCDAGELVGGKCPECLENERLHIIMQDKQAKLLNATFEQMRLDFGGIRNGK